MRRSVVLLVLSIGMVLGVCIISLGVKANAALAADVSAYPGDPLGTVCDDPVTAKDSPTCQSVSPNKNPLTGPEGTLVRISRMIAIITGMIAIIVMIIAGIRYVTSGGDAQKIANAKNTIVGAIIGIIVIVMAQAIITYVVKGIQ